MRVAGGTAFIAVLLLGLLAHVGGQPLGSAGSFAPPPANAGFDYQIGGDYRLAPGVSVVSRDWFSGGAADEPIYSICYVNAFQTQADERGVDRPDERSNWPRQLVLTELGDDPNWGGEYLVDIGSAKQRRRAGRWVRQMIDACARKGYEAVEYDNLDSWTRFDGTPLENRVPFEKPQALAYARLLARVAHANGLAVGQKNAADVTPAQARRVGFDFAIAEECARYDECGRYRRVHGDRLIAIEYRRKDFRKACRNVGDDISVVLRDVEVSTPASRSYVYDTC
jgi:endo-alpha-1,4-polygalactosaminidase (GH114 family)